MIEKSMGAGAVAIVGFQVTAEESALVARQLNDVLSPQMPSCVSDSASSRR